MDGASTSRDQKSLAGGMRGLCRAPALHILLAVLLLLLLGLLWVDGCRNVTQHPAIHQLERKWVSWGAAKRPHFLLVSLVVPGQPLTPRSLCLGPPLRPTKGSPFFPAEETASGWEARGLGSVGRLRHHQALGSGAGCAGRPRGARRGGWEALCRGWRAGVGAQAGLRFKDLLRGEAHRLTWLWWKISLGKGHEGVHSKQSQWRIPCLGTECRCPGKGPRKARAFAAWSGTGASW